MGSFRNAFLRSRLELSAKRRDMLDSTVNRLTTQLTQAGAMAAPVRVGDVAYFAFRDGKTERPLHGGRLFECVSATGFCTLSRPDTAPDAPYKATFGWNATFAEIAGNLRETRSVRRKNKPFRIDSLMSPRVELVALSMPEADAVGLRVPPSMFRAGKYSPIGEALVYRILLRQG